MYLKFSASTEICNGPPGLRGNKGMQGPVGETGEHGEQGKSLQTLYFTPENSNQDHLRCKNSPDIWVCSHQFYTPKT